MLLAQNYAPDLTKVKDYLVETPLGYMVRGDFAGAGDKLGKNAKLRVDAMMNPETAIDTGMDLMGGGLLGTFVGKGSKLWKKADYNKALKLEKEGATPEQIWQETGTAKFADGKWRQEISDQNATIKAKYNPAGYYETQNLGEFIEHPQLFKSYPDSQNIDISQQSTGGIFGTEMSGAAFSPKSYSKGIEYPNRITLYPDRLTSPDKTKSALLHENQHYIQEVENFAKGGNPDQVILDFQNLANQKREEAQKLLDLNQAFGSLSKEQLGSKADEVYSAKDKALKLEEQAKVFDEKAKEAYLDNDKAFDLYKRMAGEAEARLTQSRMNLTDAERRANFPYSYGTDYGLDYPMEELFVQGLLK
jgi:hypothetical protein